LNNGTSLHAYVLLNILLESGADGWIRQYQLIQNKPGLIEVHIWPRRPPEQRVLESLAESLEAKTSERLSAFSWWTGWNWMATANSTYAAARGRRQKKLQHTG